MMPLKRFQQLQRLLHFVDNSTQNDVSATDILLKIKPIIDMVRQKRIKVEPEESHSVDEQIIPCRDKRSKIRQYDRKNLKNGASKTCLGLARLE